MMYRNSESLTNPEKGHIKNKIVHIQRMNDDNFLIGIMIHVVALTLLLCPFVPGKYMTKQIKLIYLIGGIMLSGAQVFHADKSKKTAALKTVYDKYINQGIANEIQRTQQTDKIADQIIAQEELVYLVESLPDWKKARYIQQYKLQGLLKPIQGKAPEQIPQETGKVQVRKALPVFDKKAAKILDTSWMNHEFFFKNTVVTGNEGSGKTVVLAFMALNILAIAPDTDLKIHNIHYDPDDRWFPNMPQEIEESLFITDPQQCLSDMTNVYAELIDREENKRRDVHPIIRICDEFQGLADLLGKETWDDYVNYIIQIKNRGRKYARKIDGKDTGMRIICGTHSMKKTMTGLDSSFFAGSNVLCLGESIKDTSTPFPADFNIKELVKGLAIAKAQLADMGFMFPGDETKDTARPAVVRLGNGEPSIRVIPKPDLTSIEYEELNYNSDDSIENTPLETATTDSEAAKYPGDTYLDKIIMWYRGKKGQVTDDQIKQEMFSLTGKQLTDELLAQLKTILDRSYRVE